jgi:outer membrane protein
VTLRHITRAALAPIAKFQSTYCSSKVHLLSSMQQRILYSLLPLVFVHQATWAAAAEETVNDTPLYMGLGATQIGLSTQTNLLKGPALFAGSVDSSTRQSLIKISAGKYITPHWTVEASIYADSSGRNRLEVNQPAVGQLLSAKVSTFTLSTHYHWFEPQARIRPYAGATLARASFASEQLGAFAQANGYDIVKISSAWGLGLSAGVQAKFNSAWRMNLNYFWVPLKSQIDVASSSPFAPAIQAEFKVKASGLGLSLMKEF